MQKSIIFRENPISWILDHSEGFFTTADGDKTGILRCISAT